MKKEIINEELENVTGGTGPRKIDASLNNPMDVETEIDAPNISLSINNLNNDKEIDAPNISSALNNINSFKKSGKKKRIESIIKNIGEE